MGFLPNFPDGSLVTATTPVGHAITGEWDRATARLVFMTSGLGGYSIPIEQLEGCTFTRSIAA